LTDVVAAVPQLQIPEVHTVTEARAEAAVVGTLRIPVPLQAELEKQHQPENNHIEDSKVAMDA